MLIYIKQQKKNKIRSCGIWFLCGKSTNFAPPIYIGLGKGRIKRNNKEEKIIDNAENNQ